MLNEPQPYMARPPLWADATFHATSTAAQRAFSINKPFFIAPTAGRKITAGFSWMHRIGRQAAMDVWFPEILRQELDSMLASGGELGPGHFPAEWAAVRQFELLQEAGNYKIYDMDATNLGRTLIDLARNMRAGGYRVTVATIGSYEENIRSDDLAILDRRLQDRIARLTHMLYLEEQSAEINKAMDRTLAEGEWDYQSALPHIGVTLGAGDLFKSKKKRRGSGDRQHQLARRFFDILSRLPQKHVVHDTAVGLQLPEAIAENEQIYLAEGDMTLRAFNGLLADLFTPFDKVSLSSLHERADAGSEIKPTVQHMRGYGDRLTDESDRFQRDAARYTLQ